MSENIQFPQGPFVGSDGRVTLEWYLWLQNPQFITVNLGTVLSVSSGGTGLSSGTSGGILGFTATDTIASSGLLNANRIVLGGGAGATPSTPLALGTTTQVLHGNAGGAPTWGSVSLTADVSGDLPFSNLEQGAALSVLGVTGNATADVASIAAASDNQVLRRSGTAVAFGAINLASSNAVTGVLGVSNGGTGGITLAAGTYTPTLTNVANLTASTAYECQYLQVGATVTVSGKADVDPTAPAVSTQLGISLPVASNIGATEDCAGTAACPAISGQCAAILGDAANNRAQMEWISADITNQPMYFTFSYQVI